jgi:hypothetical protein
VSFLLASLVCVLSPLPFRVVCVWGLRLRLRLRFVFVYVVWPLVSWIELFVSASLFVCQSSSQGKFREVEDLKNKLIITLIKESVRTSAFFVGFLASGLYQCRSVLLATIVQPDSAVRHAFTPKLSGVTRSVKRRRLS